MERSIRSRGRPVARKARRWTNLPAVLATAAVVLTLGIPGGPFGSNTARAAVEDDHVSIQPNLVLDTARFESTDAQSAFIMLGVKNNKGHAGANDKGDKGGEKK